MRWLWVVVVLVVLGVRPVGAIVCDPCPNDIASGPIIGLLGLNDPNICECDWEARLKENIERHADHGCWNDHACTLTGSGSIDCGAAGYCRPAKRGTSLPGTCTQGDQFQKTGDGTLWLCTATNTFSQVGTSGSTQTNVVFLPAAGCDNATAGTFWDLPTANAPQAACRTGTNTQKGVLDFDQTTAETAFQHVSIPTSWDGTLDVRILWEANSTSTNSVVWDVRGACVADGEADDPSLSLSNAITDANAGTAAHKVNIATDTSLSLTSCAAGEMLVLRIGRLPTNPSDTLAADARLIEVELTF